ncbi:MAG TPA: protein kinase [Thermoanaerobaculia bacterium]|nr:protein kinase [Thermoanaerobaculia bacterium]
MSDVSAGVRLGHYELLARIGEGGMGEVWRARDVRLDRSVAIKLLSSNLAASPQLRQRFEREARAISALNHPHICTLHDVGEEGGRSYLVMELLEGETLADRIVRGPLPLSDVVRYGSQIADALDRAHRAGIIHRDLKPGNIMITRSGAKLLDFGLAKAASPVMSVDGPTIQKPLTQEGTILGTVQYMAPEQLEGQDADARTDIFALGAVLYEMTTGRRAFEGKTRTSLIAAIVGSDPPPIRNSQPLTPTALEHVIATCLEKEPDRRWQSAHDVASELSWIAGGSAIDQAPVRRARRRLATIVIIALALIAAAAIGMLVRERTKAPEPLAFAVMPPHGFSLWSAAISPDGRSIALVAGTPTESSLWVRRLGEINGTRLTAAGAFRFVIRGPFWSTDSQWIGFVSDGRVMKIRATGGAVETLAKLPGYYCGAAWNAKGDILYAPRFGTGLYRVPSGGGEAVPITTLDPKRRETLNGWPRFLPDGDHFLYVSHTIGEEPNEIYAGSLTSKMKQKVLQADALVGVWDGKLLFVRNGAIYAQPFDTKTLAVSGEAHSVIDEVLFFETAANASTSMADDGAILYPPASNALMKTEIGWYDDSGRPLQKLFELPAFASDLRLTRDESRIAMARWDPRKGANDIVIRDVARGVETRVTGGLSDNGNPVWSRDGSRIYFASDRDGAYNIYSQTDDGVSPPQHVWKGGDDNVSHDVSPDGTILLAGLYLEKTKNDIWIVPLNGGAPRPWIATDANELYPRFSPDGKWVVYSSDRSGRLEVYVAAFPEGRSFQVSTAGGRGPDWDADGKHVVFEQDDDSLCSVAISTSGTTVVPSKPVVLFQLPKTINGWWRSRTAKRFLGRTVLDPAETVQVMHYIKGW